MKCSMLLEAPWFRGGQESEGVKLSEVACSSWFSGDIGGLAALKAGELGTLVSEIFGK